MKLDGKVRRRVLLKTELGAGCWDKFHLLPKFARVDSIFKKSTLSPIKCPLTENLPLWTGCGKRWEFTNLTYRDPLPSFFLFPNKPPSRKEHTDLDPIHVWLKQDCGSPVPVNQLSYLSFSKKTFPQGSHLSQSSNTLTSPLKFCLQIMAVPAGLSYWENPVVCDIIQKNPQGGWWDLPSGGKKNI